MQTLERPLLIEGEAGVGKTEIAKGRIKESASLILDAAKSILNKIRKQDGKRGKCT